MKMTILWSFSFNSFIKLSLNRYNSLVILSFPIQTLNVTLYMDYTVRVHSRMKFYGAIWPMPNKKQGPLAKTWGPKKKYQCAYL